MRKKSSSKPTPNQLEYARQIRRIKGIFSRGEKQGYMFDKSIIANKPKKITKKLLNELANTSSKDIYENAIWVDTDTGEFVQGSEKKKQVRQEAARKGHETRKAKKNKGKNDYPNGGNIIANTVIDEFISKLQSPSSYEGRVDDLIDDMHSPDAEFVPFTKRVAYELDRANEESRRSKTTILSLTYRVMNEIGKANLGWRLNDMSNVVSECTHHILYGSTAEDVASACRELAEVINGKPLTMSELQDLAEQEEYNESHEFPV